jgi:hypothetical protein
VAAWKQDVGSANQSRSDLVASSLDGGKTWKRRTIPELTACTGGTADAGSDLWVAGVLAHDRRWPYLVVARPGRPAGPVGH